MNIANFVAIYNKLVKINNRYAQEFVILINCMKELSATEFINSFCEFAYNNFSIKNLSSDNIILNPEYLNKKTLPGILQIISISSMNKNRFYDEIDSDFMKIKFNKKILNMQNEKKDMQDESYIYKKLSM